MATQSAEKWDVEKMLNFPHRFKALHKAKLIPRAENDFRRAEEICSQLRLIIDVVLFFHFKAAGNEPNNIVWICKVTQNALCVSMRHLKKCQMKNIHIIYI